jgi:two-component system, NtrC family, nitrogen regulation response regulator NtrX
MIKILIIDDERNIRLTLTDVLNDEGYEVKSSPTGEKGIKDFSTYHPDLVLLDVRLPGIDGLETLKIIKEIDMNIPVVMISGNSDISTAVQALQSGAYDFVEKPLSMAKILTVAKNLTRKIELEKKVSIYENSLDSKYEIRGKSKQIESLKALLPRIAQSNSKVLIRGESGTGKELVAYAIHHLSNRKAKPFIKFNSAAIPNELIESELFGYEKGAFTGAETSKKGKIELADNGTLFLDEIGDMSLEAQAKILRVIEDGVFERVGSTESRKINIRIVVATHKDLERNIQDRTFREDLFHRLNVVPIAVPPLRDRVGDIEELAEHFLELFAQELKYEQKILTKNAINILSRYQFPGNVRELKNLIERLYIIHPENTISSDMLKPQLSGKTKLDNQFSNKFSEAKREFEKQFLSDALKKHDWNISQTAKSIDIAQPNLSRKIKELGIENRN